MKSFIAAFILINLLGIMITIIGYLLTKVCGNKRNLIQTLFDFNEDNRNEPFSFFTFFIFWLTCTLDVFGTIYFLLVNIIVPTLNSLYNWIYNLI